MLHGFLLLGTMMYVSSQATTVYESASVKFLAITDFYPSDETCIYSSNLFAYF